MRIKQISVKGLFNTFNYIIPLNLADRITILHGPNGYGKTILLNMLDGLFNNHLTNESILLKIPFTEFQIDFDDENRLLLTKNNGLNGLFLIKKHCHTPYRYLFLTPKDSRR